MRQNRYYNSDKCGKKNAAACIKVHCLFIACTEFLGNRNGKAACKPKRRADNKAVYGTDTAYCRKCILTYVSADNNIIY